MTAAWITFWATAAICGVMAHAVIRTCSRSIWRHVAVPLVVIAMTTLAIGLAQTVGEPRPWRLAWNQPDMARVLGFRIDEGRAIHVMLDRDGEPPILLSLPYSTRAAQELEDAERERQRRRGRPGEIMMRVDRSLERDPFRFHPRPVPSRPPKTGGG